MNTKRLFPALFAVLMIAGAFVALMPEVSACNTSNIYVSNGGSYSKVYGPDGNNGDTTRYVTYGTTTDIEAGGTHHFQFKITLAPGCGSYYEVMFKTHSKPDGWTVVIKDNTTGVGKAVGTDIDGVYMGSLDAPKEGFSGTVTYICDVIVTTAEDSPLGTTGNFVEIEVYSEDRACNDADHIYVKLPFRVVEQHDPPVVVMNYPAADTMASMTLDISYNAHDTETDDQDIKVDLLLKKEGANSWSTAVKNMGKGGNDQHYTWDCSNIADGSYIIKVKAFDDGVPQKFGQADVPIEINNPNRPEVWITSPDPTQSEIFMNEMPIRWGATDEEEEDDGTLVIDLYYTTEGTMDWFEIATGLTNNGEYLWNISEMEDRPDYRIKAVATDSTDRSGEYITPYKHQINNLDGPVVEMVYPTGGQTFSGNFVIYWQATDTDGDPLLITIEWSNDHGQTWEILADDVCNEGKCSHTIDSLQYPDGDGYMVKITADDGEMQGYKTCDEPFSIFNNDIPEVTITSPETGDEISGVVMIEWEAHDGIGEDPPGNLTADVYYKKGLSTYETLLTGQPNEGFYEWDTTSNPVDFTDNIYGIKVVVTDSHGATAVHEIEGLQVYNPDAPELSVDYPTTGETIKGKYSIKWASVDDDGDQVSLSIYHSRDLVSWTPIIEDESNSGSYQWDTNGVEDGIYHIKLTSTDGELVTEYVVMNITVLNYVNYDPEISVLTPSYDQEISGNFSLRWEADDDNDQDILKIAIGYSQNLATYTTFVEDLENSGEYIWDTSTMEDGEYTLKLIVSDGEGGEAFDISKRFFIKNNVDSTKPTGGTGDTRTGGDESSTGLIIGIIIAIIVLLAILAVVAFVFIRGSRSDDGAIDPLKMPLPTANAPALQRGIETGALPPPPGQGLPPPQR